MTDKKKSDMNGHFQDKEIVYDLPVTRTVGAELGLCVFNDP